MPRWHQDRDPDFESPNVRRNDYGRVIYSPRDEFPTEYEAYAPYSQRRRFSPREEVGGPQWRSERAYRRQGSESRGQYSGIGPKAYQRPDRRIYEEICEHLTWSPQIDASSIEVTVEKGEVTLSGEVDSRRTKRLAEEEADNVRGVVDVHNQLRVRRS